MDKKMEKKRCISIILSALILTISLIIFGIYCYQLIGDKTVTYKDGIIVERVMEDEKCICDAERQCQS
ncbi:MAG: hypothetical protein U0K68_10135 [Agathobacter sp.]|nr:hypothetical protein [Agathobacter sp.]